MAGVPVWVGASEGWQKQAARRVYSEVQALNACATHQELSGLGLHSIDVSRLQFHSVGTDGCLQFRSVGADRLELEIVGGNLGPTTSEVISRLGSCVLFRLCASVDRAFSGAVDVWRTIESKILVHHRRSH